MGNGSNDDDDSGGRTERRTPIYGIEQPTLEARFFSMELRHAEIFGVDGNGGRFRALEKNLRDAIHEHEEETRLMKAEIDTLKTFKTKALTAFALATSAAGVIVGLAAILIEHYLK